MTNEILAETESLSKLLLNHKYEVDYYQREYVWETNQVHDLIDDLTNQFRDHSNRKWDRDKVHHSYKPYFMGSIIICERRRSTASSIVDGQQRLTSLTLLLIFLYHKLKSEADSEQIRQHIKSRKAGKLSFNLNIPERKDCMDSLLEDEGESFIATDKTESVANLIDRYEDIKAHFPEDILENKRILLCFRDWLLEKVKMSKITTTSNEDAYAIFETMNDRGKSLTLTDMLKGYLLTNITNQDSRTEAQDVWLKEIRALQDTDEKLEPRYITAWLRGQHAKTMRDRRKGAKNKDFELIATEFNRWVRGNSKKLGLKTSKTFENFIKKDFRFYSHWYRQIYNWAYYEYSPDFQAIRSNAWLGFNLQFSAILSALRLQDKEEDIRCKIKIVSTYIDILLARYISNHKSISESALRYHIFHSVILKIRNKSVRDVAKILQKNIQKSGTIPMFARERDFWFHGTNRWHIHLFLARITDYIETQSKRPTRFEEYINETTLRKNRFQIEHIVANNPQKYRNDIYRDRNYIGSLLLLPATINSSLKDKSYKKKNKVYRNQNLLAASLHPDTYQNDPSFNKFIEKSGLKFKGYSDLTYELLDERYYLYLEIAKQIWDPAQITKIAEER